MALSDDIFGFVGKFAGNVFKGAIVAGVVAALIVGGPAIWSAVGTAMTAGSSAGLGAAVWEGVVLGAGAFGEWLATGAIIGGITTVVPGLDTWKSWFSGLASGTQRLLGSQPEYLLTDTPSQSHAHTPPITPSHASAPPMDNPYYKPGLGTQLAGQGATMPAVGQNR